MYVKLPATLVAGLQDTPSCQLDVGEYQVYVLLVMIIHGGFQRLLGCSA